MPHPIVILCSFCKRFKSSSNARDKVNAIRKLQTENLFLYGKLLETRAQKRKRLKKEALNLERMNDGSAGLLKEATPESIKKQPKWKAIPRCDRKELTNKSIEADSASNILRAASSKLITETGDSTSNILRATPNKLITETINYSVLSFPLLNPSKNKYNVNNDSEVMRIGQLSNYHSDYTSVSKILSESMSSQSAANLERWRTRKVSELGQEGFDSFNRNQMLLGSMFRRYIIKYLTGVPEDDLDIRDELKNCWLSAKAVFPVFQSIVDCGGLVAHPDLKYKGVFDCLAVFRNEVVLVSWKKSEKYVPSLDRTFDVRLQIAAYMGALNFDDRYPFRVEQALLVMAYSDGSKADLFHLNEERCASYWKQWLERYNMYLKRVEEKGEQKKREIKPEPRVLGNQTDSEKIDIDYELEKIACGAQFSPRIIKESKEEEEEKVEDSALFHPLINSEKLDHDPAKNISLEPPVEYQNNSYPSVSSILSETKSDATKRILEQWRQSMIEKLGQEGFEMYEKKTLESGSTLHEFIRKHLSGEFAADVEIPKNIQGFWRSVSSVFPRISNVLVTESEVAHPVCKYRGIIDCIGFYQGKLVLIDWKTSEKPKTSVSMTYDAPVQVAAYIGAVNFDPRYSFKVEEGLIVVVYSDGTEANIFHLDKKKCVKYWKKWLDRLKKYQTMAYENGTKIHY